MPTTVEPGATSFVTTELAPIFAPSPTSIGPSTCAPEPMTTPSTDRRVALAADAGRRVGAAERDMLVDGDVVADLGGLADHAEAVVEEEALADLRAGMDVDRGQEAREMIDQPREEIEPPLPQPVREAVQSKRPDARIEQHVPARTRRRIARFDRIEIGDKPGIQAA